VAGDGYAIQGNILTGPEVVDAMREAWLANEALPLGRRLLATLLAGDAAGGDKRGRQSAAIYVMSKGHGYGGSDLEYDLRVDDHPEPCPELVRLMDIHDALFARADYTPAADATSDSASAANSASKAKIPDAVFDDILDEG
jgi:uncharacterized Ntn-hydrolase superfamily protein